MKHTKSSQISSKKKRQILVVIIVSVLSFITTITVILGFVLFSKAGAKSVTDNNSGGIALVKENLLSGATPTAKRLKTYTPGLIPPSTSNKAGVTPANPVVTSGGLPGNVTNNSRPLRTLVYRVRTGDRLTELAEMYNTSIAAILNTNRDSDALGQPGQVFFDVANPSFPIAYAGSLLVIPEGRTSFTGIGLIVQNGQTLVSISTKYGVTGEAILQFNGLTVIKVGDPLLIP